MSFAIDKLSSTLNITMDRPPKPQQGLLLNKFEEENSKVVSAKMTHPEVFVDGDLRPLTEEEMELPALRKQTFTIVDKTTSMTFNAENGKCISVRDLFKAIGQFETVARAKSDWFGGVDTHHVYFEGMYKVGKDQYTIFWGS